MLFLFNFIILIVRIVIYLLTFIGSLHFLLKRNLARKRNLAMIVCQPYPKWRWKGKNTRESYHEKRKLEIWQIQNTTQVKTLFSSTIFTWDYFHMNTIRVKILCRWKYVSAMHQIKSIQVQVCIKSIQIDSDCSSALARVKVKRKNTKYYSGENTM